MVSAPAANDGLNHARQQLARALFQNGERTEAIHRYEQLGSGTDNHRGYSYAVAGRRMEAEAAAVRRKDFPDPRVGIYLTYPELSLLRADPRMAAFRRKLGLPN